MHPHPGPPEAAIDPAFQRNLLEAQNEASPDGLLVTGAGGRILSFNRRFSEIWALPEEVLASRDGGLVLAHATEHMADPAAFLARVEYLNRHPDERSRDQIAMCGGRVLDCYSAPVRGADGELYGRVWVFRDVTERVRAEAERRQRVEFLESLERVDKALKHQGSLDEVLRRVLDACLAIFGSDRAWLLHPCDPDAPSWRVPLERTRAGYPGALVMGVEIPMLDEARAVFRAALENDGPVAYDRESGRPLPPDAAERFFVRSQVTLVLRPRVGRPWLFGMHQCSYPRVWSDGDRRLLREAGRRVSDALSSLLYLRDLTRREEQYRELVEGSSDLIARFDDEGRFLFVNHRAREVFGVSPEECVGQSALVFVHPEDRGRTRAAFAAWAGGLRATTFENRQVSRTGEVRELFWTVNLDYDDAGRLSDARAIGRDIGERKRAERERLDLERQVQHAQKLESLGVLAGGIAHDFNNLLMAVLGNADLALVELSPSAPAREYVERIAQATQRAAELTRQMLAYSGKGRFVVESLDLNRLVEEMGHLLGTVLSKKATVRFDLAPDLPAVEGDAGQLRQVVMNLLTNASEALGDGAGSVSLRTGVIEADHAALHGYLCGEDAQPGDFVFLEVTDSGCGMDPETLQRLFDPFYTTKFTGRGLGLAAVLGIARGHRGAIRVESAAGRGSTFRVLLPACGAALVASAPLGSAQEGAKAVGARILLVDDDPKIREVGTAMLSLAGHRVVTAENGREALAVYHAERHRLDLVILDLTMPELDGTETLRELRRLAPGVKVLLSSGYGEESIAANLGQERPSGFLQKPYRSADLLAAVLKALGR